MPRACDLDMITVEPASAGVRESLATGLADSDDSDSAALRKTVGDGRAGFSGLNAGRVRGSESRSSSRRSGRGHSEAKQGLAHPRTQPGGEQAPSRLSWGW